jgi:hypothetical protein
LEPERGILAKLAPAFVDKYDTPGPYVPYMTTLGSSFAMSVPHVELVVATLLHVKPEFVLLVTLVELHAVANPQELRSLETAIIGISDDGLE